MSAIPEDIRRVADEVWFESHDLIPVDAVVVIANAIIAERERSRTALSEAEQRARREALEEAAKTIEEGFDRGIASKHDMCIHKKFEWEDCESCAANAVRALIPSEPHDAEGRE